MSVGAAVPRPPSLRLLNGRAEGRDSGGRLVPPTPGYVRIPPSPPEWLDREAKAEWKRVVPQLQRLELVKQLDRAALAAYCSCWSRLHAAIKLRRDKGMTVVTSQGVGVAPWVRIEEAASRELRGWCQEFGFTPSAEGRMTAPAADAGDSGDDPFA